jgi:uroporphyrinogen-III synthase
VNARLLEGARVALLESRRQSELARLVERQGGVPTSAPALDEAEVAPEELAGEIEALARGEFRMVVLSTGVGVERLLGAAEALGAKERLVASLTRATTVCRGPKPSAALRRAGITPTVLARDPFTTAELLHAMAPLELTGTPVALLHYGERNAALADALLARGALLREVVLYRWALPEDTGPLDRLVAELVAGAFDALLLTSQVQVRHLRQRAAALGRGEALVAMLRSERLIVASIGPTTTASLAEIGVTPGVVPAEPKMGPLVAALGAAWSTRPK